MYATQMLALAKSKGRTIRCAITSVKGFKTVEVASTDSLNDVRRKIEEAPITSYFTGGPMYSPENVFTYHPPKTTQQVRYEALRARAKGLAELILDSCPDSLGTGRGSENLEQSIMWGNAAIARNE